MLHYISKKLIVYIEPTVISYLVARQSADVTLASWQHVTRQMWEDYTDRFEFVISPIVLSEVRQGTPTAAARRLEAIRGLRVLEILPEADTLAQKLLDAGAVPQNSRTDAEHIALTTIHSTDYLVSWNHKHIVNANKLGHIKQVCQEAGLQPITICTPAELIQEFEMKETQEEYTNPILEECYRIKDEINAQFKTIEELSAYLKAQQEEDKRQGWKYVSFFDASKHAPLEKRNDDI